MKDTQVLAHLMITPGQIAPYVIVCGDPARAEAIAKKMDNAEEISYNREFRVFNGEYNGSKISVASHGVGAAGALSCFEELIMAGARVLIRVGTAGSLSKSLRDGDLIIATGAVREDGVTDQLVPKSFPAVADLGVTDALYKISQKHRLNVGLGTVLSVGAFYPGPLESPNRFMSEVGVLGVEMEVSTLLVTAAIRGVRAGAIVALDGVVIDFDSDTYNPYRDVVDKAIEAEIEIALETMAFLEKQGYGL